MITISTESHYDASILIGLQAIIMDSDDEELPGRDKLRAITRLLSNFADGTGTWMKTVASEFDIEDNENLDDDMLSELKLLRRQCQLLDRALEGLLSARAP